MQRGELAIIRKELRAITANRQLLSVILVVPLILAVAIPLIFVLVSHFAPSDSADFQQLLALMPELGKGQDVDRQLLSLVINNLMPMFFLMIPLMASSVMAGNAFVSEKEQRTLETLLYSPLSLLQVFRAKVLAAFGLGMMVSAMSFIAMLLTVELGLFFTRSYLLWPGIGWLIILLLVAPAVSLIAITLMVRVSAKAKNAVEAQQSAGFLVLPLVLALAGQLTGLLFINAWALLGIGIVAAAIAWLLLRQAMRRFTYERLLM